MLYHLLTPLSDGGDVFNLFRYITFRFGGALLTSLLLFMLFGRRVIDWMRVVQKKGQPIRADGPQRHIVEKTGTPTMGGVMILGAMLISTLIWARLDQGFVWIVLMVTLGFGLIGFADDYLKVTKHHIRGVPGKIRLLAGLTLGLIAALWAGSLTDPTMRHLVHIPYTKNWTIDLMWFYPVFGALVVVGAANAVNLTDGLDGLAIMPVIIAASSFALIAYVVGRADFSDYLGVTYVAGTGEIAVLCGAMIGAGLGFLWFNAPPAQIFMGDTGSLALGAALGSMAVVTKHELVLAIIGGLFVAETLSVIIQVTSFKTTGKRVFKMAPVHHHFEQLGWREPTIVIRFWIIALVLALIGLASLKIR